MSDNANVQLMRQMFRAVEAGDIEFIVSHVAPEATRHDLVGAFPDVGGGNVGDFINTVRAGVPDMALRIEDIFGADDRVTVRFRIEGTHAGELYGVPGTGKRISVNAINIYRLADGRVAETWQLQDVAGFQAQIGLSVQPAP